MDKRKKDKVKKIIHQAVTNKIEEKVALEQIINLMEKHADSRLARYLELEGSKKLP